VRRPNMAQNIQSIAIGQVDIKQQQIPLSRP
jgi:hypothetical protein